MKKLALTAGALALMAAGLTLTSVWAQTSAPGTTGGMMVPSDAMRHHAHPKHMDKDGDKMLSREEAKGRPHLEKNFEAMDTNKDGKLSPDERKAFHAQRKTEHMKKLDPNGDGMVSREEAKGHPQLEKGFDAMDTNKDGKLSKEEMQAARKHHARSHDHSSHPAK